MELGLFQPGEPMGFVPQINTAESEGLTGLIQHTTSFKTPTATEIEQLITDNLDNTKSDVRSIASTLPSQDLSLTLATASLPHFDSTDLLTGQATAQAESAALDKVIEAVYQSLTDLADNEEFTAKITSAFGNHFNAETLEELRQDWAADNFEQLPTVEIRSTEELKGANGAFSQDTNTIYLSREYIKQNASNLQAITSVLLEETGHYIDSRINISDTAGDEGAIFSALVRDIQLKAPELQALKVEDDTTTIALNGQVIHIEQASEIKVDFQPDASTVPAGYIKDTGQAFDTTRGYGWVKEDSLSNATPTPLDITLNTRDRNQTGINPQLNTLLHMQYPTQISNSAAVKTPAAWEYALPNGQYKVTVGVGDPVYDDSSHTINVEGINAISGFQSSAGNKIRQATVETSVNDGKLTIDAIGGTNTKLNYIKFSPVASNTDDEESGSVVGASITKTNYPIPSGAYFVSPGGNDGNSGTETAPWGSLQKAINSAPSGSTIVLRGGTYYEGHLNVDKKLNFQPYPNEEVWLDGGGQHDRGFILRYDSSNSVIRGLGFKNYIREGVRMNSPSSNVRIENNIFTKNGDQGLVLAGPGAIVRDNTLTYNGQRGISGNYADGTLVEDNLFGHNDPENQGPKGATAGAKFTRSDSVIFQDNIAENNGGTGIWLDMSCTDATIVRNITRYNTDNGIFFEISDQAIIASNLSHDNGNGGISVHNSTNAKVFNNTLSENAVNLSVGDTTRVNSNWTEYNAGMTWQTANVVVKNNLFSNTKGIIDGWGPTLVSIYSDVDIPGRSVIAEMNNNSYHRTYSTSPEIAVRYKPTPTAQVLRAETVADFSAKTGFETSTVAIDDVSSNPFLMSEATDNHQLKATSPTMGSGAPLPSDVASAIGVQAGLDVNIGALKLPTESEVET